mmetsp:Transcript_18443/g.36220  ORF Transcript_18443/g.36220 Transcript_18443/m.36220 type:complete len:224 (+) Transcript_18443:169-840(+)
MAFRHEVRKSLFLAEAAVSTHAEEARAFVASIASRRRHINAQHHCWGFVAPLGAEERTADDGEPSGTAGRPIVEAIRANENAVRVGTVVVVARWKKGPNLGKGGLIRAYREAALGAVTELFREDSSSVVENDVLGGISSNGSHSGGSSGNRGSNLKMATIRVPFERMHEVFGVMKVVNAEMVDQGHDEQRGLALLTVQLPEEDADLLKPALEQVAGASVKWDV